MNQEPIPSPSENPFGLHGRYIVSKADGRSTDGATYFVLRIDSGGNDRDHIRACQEAAMAYCEAIEDYMPQVAKELRERIEADSLI